MAACTGAMSAITSTLGKEESSLSSQAALNQRVSLPPKPERVENETEILARIRGALNALPDVRVLRNNVGILKDVRGRSVRFGLGIGSADLLGVVRAREAQTGRIRSVPIAVEVKAPSGHTTAEQRAWLAVAEKWGVVTGVARSVGDAMAIVDRARELLR